jgi:hypothetical protein
MVQVASGIMVIPHVNSDQKQKITPFDLFSIQAQYASFKKMAHLSPEASNAFKLPLFEITILQNQKRPRTLVQILSHGGARGVCYVLPTVKKPPDDVIEKSANHNSRICSGCMFAGIGNQETSLASGDSRRTPERMTSSSWRPFSVFR